MVGTPLLEIADLTFRYRRATEPALRNLSLRLEAGAAEYFETIDAQRVRGYDPTARLGGPISRLRRMAPVFVPMTVGSLAGAEDTIDALDLRGFGTGRRTWVRHLRFAAADWLVLGAFLIVVAAAIGLSLAGLSNDYLLPFLVR